MSEKRFQIDEDVEFQRRSWKVQRVSWVVGLAVLTAAVLGLLGPGLLSAAHAGSPGDPLHVAYNRVERYQAPTTFEVDVEGGSADGTLRLWMSRELAEAVEVTAIVPEPERVEVRPDRYTYHFAAPDQGRVRIVVHYHPNRYGWVSGRIGLEGGPDLDVSSFVFP
jgi:hypothetical protein